MPTDRPIDGVDQTDVLLGKSETGNRDSLLTFIGADTGGGKVEAVAHVLHRCACRPASVPSASPACISSSAPMAGYPKIYNIEMDPHEDLQVGALFGVGGGPALEVVEKYKETLKKYPNPPAGNLARF